MADAFVRHSEGRQLWLGLDAGNLETRASEYFSDLCHRGLRVYRMFLPDQVWPQDCGSSGWWEGAEIHLADEGSMGGPWHHHLLPEQLSLPSRLEGCPGQASELNA